MNQFGRFGRLGQQGVPGAQQAMPPAPGSLPEDEYGPLHKNAKFWFTYQTPNIASIAAAGSSTNSITFDNDSAFLWTKITLQVDKANAAQTNSSLIIPFLTIQIQDTGQGAYYSNAAIPVECFMGQLGLPYVMPAPQVIAPNSTLQFNWVSYSTAGGGNETYTNVRMQLHGWKIRR